MKVTLLGQSKVNFQGYKPVKDNRGKKGYEFNFPFDEAGYDCYLEIFNVSLDKNGNFIVGEKVENTDTENSDLKLKSGANKVNLSSSYFIDEDAPFAYHYKLIDKNGEEFYRIDAGNVVNNVSNENPDRIYNIVSQNGSKLSHSGSMKLVIPDNYNAGWEYNKKLFEGEYIIKNENILKKAMNSYKHFSNKIGGTLAGIEKSLDDGEFDGYANIVSLPIFTDDSLSAHGYWNKNCMQMSQSLGNINNYASLQRKLFAKGINWVSDGAFVNEGLEGIHFANVLKWGEKSPYFNWFRASGLKDGSFQLGVFSKNQEFISHKIINSPYSYRQKSDGIVEISKNRDYEKNKPTFIQIFDDRLVSDELKNDNKNLITSYDILNTDNPYDINTHNDTIINYHFEINPETYNSNVLNLNEYNKTHKEKIKLNKAEGTRFVSKFETFELENKIESNFDTWDANTDIAKLNYVYSHVDTETGKSITPKERLLRDENIKRGTFEVQDYVITSGVYWTQKTKDILTLYSAQNLKNIDKENPKKVYKDILTKIGSGVFPDRLSKNINEEVVKNVINGKYKTNRKFYDDSYNNQVKMGLMNLPLDTVELGDNIAGVLASPYISKRAGSEEYIGVSRYDLFKQGNTHLIDKYKRAYNETQKMYDNEMSKFALDILSKVEKQLPESQKLSSGSDTSLYGKYVLPLLTQEIAKFAVIKALQPNAKVYVNKDNGEIGYDYDALKQTSLQAIGIHGVSPEDEALELIRKLRSGILEINNKDRKLLADALAKSIKDTSVESFALADMIVDCSESGLDWRIDATKDIADIDAMRNGKNDFGYAWQQVTDFWTRFNQNILKVNPNAYLAAEVTDEVDLYKDYNGENSRFGETSIVKTFLNETGLTTTANYSSYFTDIAMLFGKSFTYNKDCMEYPVDNYFHRRIFEKMIGEKDYLRSSNLQSLLYSYTFIGNHDKPRAIHCFALDMALFFSDLTDENNYQYRERAFRILNDRLYDEKAKPLKREEVDAFDFSEVSPKAIAMADLMVDVFGKVLDDMAKEDNAIKSNKDGIYKAIMQSISDLACGSYLGKNFNADAFGVKPFDVVIDTVFKQAEKEHGLKLSKKDIMLYKNKVFEAAVEPAYTRLIGAMKYLVALPGKPTLFSGDDLGATGYEEKTKNIYLQNRVYLHNEWLDDSNKEFIKNKYNELKEIMGMRSRPELDALNNGAPFTLPLQGVSNKNNRTQISAILRQNTDGKMAISLFNTAGINHNPEEGYNVKPMYLDNNKIVLDEAGEDGKIGIKGGLKEGAKFVNANNPDDVYYVHKYGNHYCLEHHDKSPILVDDSTMILYHVPEKSQAAFTGKVNYKLTANDVAKIYSAFKH